MIFGQRSHILRALVPGLIITALVIAANHLGWLSTLENQFYDARAKYCQQFTPAPTKHLVHLDIDDAALESIGRWPWPRSVLAEILDELHDSGAKVVAMDIIMPDAQPPTYVPDGNTVKRIDNDAVLADSIRKFGRVLVPVSFQFEPARPQTRVEREIAAKLRGHVGMSFDVLKKLMPNQYSDITLDDYLPTLRRVIHEQVEAAMSRKPGTLEQITQRLVPGATPANTEPIVLKTIAVQYHMYESEQAIARFGKTMDRPLPDVLTPHSALLMIPPLARAAAYSAFVDHLPQGDGVERSVPLWVLYHGRLYPQMGLALACATLGVPISHLQISDAGLIIPRPDGTRTVIPYHSIYSSRLHRRVGYLMDVPWFGTSDWRTMYDYPSHHDFAQHVPIGKVWRLAEARKAAYDNNLQIDKALHVLNDAMSLDYVTAFFAHAPDAHIIDSRIKIGEKTLADADSFAAPLRGVKPADLKPDEKVLVNAVDGLKSAIAQNKIVVAQQADLKQTFNGNSVLIGSIATSAFDFVTTPLHAQCPGVVVHGAIFNAIMLNHLWRELPFVDTAIATAVVGILATLAVAIFSPWAALLATLLIVGGYCLLNGLVLFGYEGLIVGVAGPVVAGGLVWGGVTLMRYITEVAERTRITRRFRSYADQKLVDYVLAHPEQNVFAGEERELTVVFTDMQGFTSLVERLGSGVVPALNEYMGRMTRIIQDEGGYLNKFLGDGIMFFYGAPEHDPHHAQRAMRTVMQMREIGVPGFNEWLGNQGLDIEIAVRAGVTTGMVIVGDAGSERRADYTVLGDSVNLASRLESANKYLGTRIMITQRTAELCAGEYLLRPVARIQVVGKSESVIAYEPIAPANQATDAQRRLAQVSEEIFAAFTAAQFETCLRWLTQAEKEFGESKLFSLYANQCRDFIKNPPTNFDGRIVLEGK